MDDTKGIILVAVVISSVTSVARDVSKGSITFRPVLAASIMGIFLTGIGMVNEKLAKNFAALIILGVLFRDGGHVFVVAKSVSSPGGLANTSADTNATAGTSGAGVNNPTTINQGMTHGHI